MNFQPLTIADLFEENGTVAVFCCRSWRDGGPCVNPAGLVQSAMPEEQRQEYLGFVNQAGWAKDDKERPYCPSCTLAMGNATER